MRTTGWEKNTKAGEKCLALLLILSNAAERLMALYDEPVIQLYLKLGHTSFGNPTSII
jgi:hypothetical protein